MNPCIRAMIGNHGDPLKRIRPIDREGYALFDHWEDHAFELFMVVDFEHWRREIRRANVTKIKLDRRDTLTFSAEAPGLDRPFRMGCVTASWEAEFDCHAVGVLVRITTDFGVFYCQAALPDGKNAKTGEVGPCCLRYNDGPNGKPGKMPDILTVNYSLDSHGLIVDDTDAYRPCDDFLFAFGEDYFG
jgi:hypothetical protein